MAERIRDEIDRVFTPEFLNGSTRRSCFHPLSREEIGQIVHIMLRDVQHRLGEEELRAVDERCRRGLPR